MLQALKLFFKKSAPKNRIVKIRAFSDDGYPNKVIVSFTRRNHKDGLLHTRFHIVRPKVFKELSEATFRRMGESRYWKLMPMSDVLGWVLYDATDKFYRHTR